MKVHSPQLLLGAQWPPGVLAPPWESLGWAHSQKDMKATSLGTVSNPQALDLLIVTHRVKWSSWWTQSNCLQNCSHFSFVCTWVCLFFGQEWILEDWEDGSPGWWSVCWASMRIWTQVPRTQEKERTRHGLHIYNPNSGWSRNDRILWHSLTTKFSYSVSTGFSKTLSQKVKWRAVGDETWCWPLVTHTCTHTLYIRHACTHTHTITHTYTHIHEHINSCMHTYTCTQIHRCIHAHIHIHTQAWIFVRHPNLHYITLILLLVYV